MSYMIEITGQNKRETGLIKPYFPKSSVGRELGIQVWALHPTFRGSNPRRSKNQYIKSLGGLQ